MNRLFGAESNLEKRLIPDYERLTEILHALRIVNPIIRIVLTMGGFDLFHIGHARYLEAAKRHGDLLIVGIDEDKKIKQRKGPNRPIVPESERAEILAHTMYADLIFIKRVDDEKWQLIKTARPDTLIATQDTYTEAQLEELKEYCGQVVVLQSQAKTSTSAKIRRLMLDLAELVKTLLDDVAKQVDIIKTRVDEAVGGNPS